MSKKTKRQQVSPADVAPQAPPAQAAVFCPCGSGKNFSDCHGKSAIAVPPIPQLVMAAPTTLRKLDLACGQTPKEGHEGVDLHAPNALHKVDLWKFPWPWEDSSCEELYCSHHIEHIPCREVEERDLNLWSTELPKSPGADPTSTIANATAHNQRVRDRFLGEDMFFAFFDECWRVLKPDGWIHVVTPCARNNRAFQDPTHRRFIVQETFFYLFHEFRKANKLDHYKVQCNFGGDVNSTVDAAISTRAPEVQADMISHHWNVVADWIVKLQKLPLQVRTDAAEVRSTVLASK